MTSALTSLFKPLSGFFLTILKFLHGGHLLAGTQNTWVGGRMSWAWAIVILTVIVRFVLVPLTWKQIKSMRAMQVLQPQIRAIQEKYKNDRQLLNQKMMEFYKENKVNPFGSCLPLVLQLPVFLGLYYMLRAQGQPGGLFVAPNAVVGWLWISDITKFDIILMFLYMASQFVASWQTARNSPGNQKALAFFIPVMVGIFMYIGKWPAGLFIYWFTSNLWTIAQQYVAEKLMPAPVMAATTGGTAGRGPSPGGAPSSGRGEQQGARGPSPKQIQETTPARTASRPAGAGSAGKAQAGKAGSRPAAKSGGKTSGQTASKKKYPAGSKSQRPQRGTGRPKSSS
jgi:YidC/Oxa1 family membrane protein insertase